MCKRVWQRRPDPKWNARALVVVHSASPDVFARITDEAMEPFDLAQSFIECGERAVSVDELARCFEDAVQRLGFRHFACCTHVDPLKPPRWAVVVHNFPADWVDVYCEGSLHQIDPVISRAERALLPFFWDSPDFVEPLTRRQKQFLAQAARFGISDGYTIPLHSPRNAKGLGASCSVLPDSGAIETRSYFAVQLMAMYFYAAALRMKQSMPPERPSSHLSLRERECLELAAGGKSDWAIGQILKISEHTVHRHIESAKVRLGVSTRVQAIMSAVENREIAFGDVVRPELRPNRAAFLDRHP